MLRYLRKVMGNFLLVSFGILSLNGLVHATVLESFVITGIENTFNDNSREAFFDTGDGNSGTFGVGDVVIGFVRIESRDTGGSVNVNNTMYAVFSQQVADITSGVVTFTNTTVDGLRMDQLVPTASSSAMVALLTDAGGFGGLNLSTTAPADQTANGSVTMLDYIRFLTSNGNLELTAGIVNTADGLAGDFFTAALTNGVVPDTNTIAVATGSLSFASFSAGLSIIQNFTNLTFLDEVLTNGAGGYLTLAQLAIVQGGVRGASNETPGNFRDGSEFGLTQCTLTSGAVVPCGFSDNADFVLKPVPEPGSMILFGLGLAALGMYGRRARNRAKSE